LQGPEAVEKRLSWNDYLMLYLKADWRNTFVNTIADVFEDRHNGLSLNKKGALQPLKILIITHHLSPPNTIFIFSTFLD
jgi:hypothetical protein